MQNQKTLIYQMYPNSWGNFKNMREHLERVRVLEPDYVWLSPFYKSPWMDGGYDISDYMSVEPRFGTMEDFDDFVKRANDLGIKVIIDLVLNHTSTNHEWFKKSDIGKSKYKDYYVWTDRDLGWGNQFNGGSAFEWSWSRKQYYLHLFHKTQADLNWDNPDVVLEFQKIIDFWVEEHDVSGFRLDVAQYLAKNLKRTFLPRSIAAGYLNFFQKPKTLEILHQLFDGRDLFTVAEAGAPFKPILRKLAGENGPLSATFNVLVTESLDKRLAFLETAPSLKRLERKLKSWAKEPYFVAALESHDTPRFPSRSRLPAEYGLSLLFKSNPSTVCLYQGQELGLKNPPLGLDISSYDDIQTIMRCRKMVNSGMSSDDALRRLRPISRDNARQPIDIDCYEIQLSNPHSALNTTIDLIDEWRSKI